jgi:hypothetical protein
MAISGQTKNNKHNTCGQAKQCDPDNKENKAAFSPGNKIDYQF